MKIAVTCQGDKLDDQMDQRFGRSPFFLIVDSDTMEYEAIENTNATLGQGAGIQSAQMISSMGVEVLVTGNCGPKAFDVFNASGVKVITGVSGSVRQAVEDFKGGKLTSSQAPTVGDKFGSGMGGGRGMGGGCRGGGGRGRGCGGGQGRGGGQGGGQGRKV